MFWPRWHQVRYLEGNSPHPPFRLTAAAFSLLGADRVHRVVRDLSPEVLGSPARWSWQQPQQKQEEGPGLWAWAAVLGVAVAGVVLAALQVL